MESIVLSDKRLVQQCLRCKKTLHRHPIKYCSRQCYWLNKKAGEERICPICDELFWVPPNVVKKIQGKFCSKFCYAFEKMLRGGEFRECPSCNVVFHVSDARIKLKKGRFCSLECYDRGITPLLNRIRGIWMYEIWRKGVLERDNYTCQRCGLQDTVMEAHHVKRFSIILHEYGIKSVEEAKKCESLWNIDNGRTYCVPCHRDLEIKYGVD